VAWFCPVPRKLVASVMAFGAGVLVSALSFDEAETSDGLVPTVIGFLAGAVIYVAANIVLARHGARHGKRSGDQQPSESEQGGSGAVIAIGALLDGVLESVVLRLSLLGAGGIGVPVLAAIFISTLPEGPRQLRRHETQRQERRVRLRRLDRHRRPTGSRGSSGASYSRAPPPPR
jgi:ZIP family zinc transporter